MVTAHLSYTVPNGREDIFAILMSLQKVKLSVGVYDFSPQRYGF